MGYYDANETIEVESECEECGHKQNVNVELGINITPAEIKSIEVIG